MFARLEAAFEAQRRFVANAAHELRTPLTAIRGSLEVLMRGAQDDPATAARLTQGMYREVVRLSRLSEQLLDLSRVGATTSVHKRPVAIAAFFDNFLSQARLLARDRTVTLEPGPAVTLLADPDALTEMLFNLVDNAVQHTDEGGVITLGWRTTPEAVQLWVADDGEGIPAADLPHIFEPFYRGDSSRSRRQGGSGLGLALVRALAQAHGGRVSVESQPGQGAKVTITLPRGEAGSQSG
jgi:signal transduction histidine kinase